MDVSAMEAADHIWKYAVSEIETLKLIDRQKLMERVQVLNKEVETFDMDQAARAVLQAIWDLHPLHAKLTRQMQEFQPSDALGKALLEAWNILPPRLVETHWELVKKAAKRHHIPTQFEDEAEFQELMSVGREALFMAAQKFFKRPKGSFKSFAWSFMRESMREEQRNRHPVPPSVLKKLATLGRLREEYHVRDLTLTRDIILRELKLSENEAKELLATEAVWGSGQPFEHDHILEELEVADYSLDSLGMIMEVENVKLLEEAMSGLGEPEASIIRKLYFEERSYREAAEDLGVSLPAFKRYHKKALESMREHFAQPTEYLS
ncbi:MAG: sigma-70 family RNA polymerase sigma factor [Chitinophagaceae bacterium]|nr:sigma-70 family RNA polymerase sigma factor [Oligoflexus sp.]